MKINVKEARKNFSSLLKNVDQGEEVVILRRDKEIARLVPLERKPKKLPSLQKFRSSIKTKGLSLSKEVIKQRNESGY